MELALSLAGKLLSNEAVQDAVTDLMNPEAPPVVPTAVDYATVSYFIAKKTLFMGAFVGLSFAGSITLYRNWKTEMPATKAIETCAQYARYGVVMGAVVGPLFVVQTLTVADPEDIFSNDPVAMSSLHNSDLIGSTADMFAVGLSLYVLACRSRLGVDGLTAWSLGLGLGAGVKFVVDELRWGFVNVSSKAT